MALVVYEFTQDVGANKQGEQVQLDSESEMTQALLSSGVIEEATEASPDEPEEPADPMAEAAITRSIREGLKEVKDAVLKAQQTRPVSIGNFAAPKSHEPIFKNLGDQCRAEYKAAKGDVTSRNKIKAWEQECRQKAPAGMNYTNAADGGRLVIPTWSDEVFSKVKDYPRLLDMCKRVTISGNTHNLPAWNETSLVDGSRGAGIRAYWTAEGNNMTTSYPVLTQVTSVLNKLTILVPLTNELLEDAAFDVNAEIQQLVGDEFTFQEDRYLISGSGTNQPKGIMNQPSLITISKEAGQAAATVVYQNLLKMWAALYPGYQNNAVWLINPQVERLLQAATFPNASGTYSAFGALTYNAADEVSQFRIFGRPVIKCLMCPDLGLPGDIILCDLKQLTVPEHAGMQVAVSDQVYFVSDQTLLKFTRRWDAQSQWTAALTDFNNHYSYSPFVVLESRGT